MGLELVFPDAQDTNAFSDQVMTLASDSCKCLVTYWGGGRGGYCSHPSVLAGFRTGQTLHSSRFDEARGAC